MVRAYTVAAFAFHFVEHWTRGLDKAHRREEGARRAVGIVALVFQLHVRRHASAHDRGYDALGDVIHGAGLEPDDFALARASDALVVDIRS